MYFKDQNKYKKRDRRERDKNTIPLGVTVRYTGDSEEQRTADLEKALAKFKKILSKEGFMLELKERQYYKSPSRKIYEQRKKFRYRLQVKREKAEQITRDKENGIKPKRRRRE